MKRTCHLMAAIGLMVFFAGCASNSAKMQKKEEGATSEARITLTKKYTDCVSKAGTDKAAVEACDTINTIDAILNSIKELK
ncbi:hypothetical protein [Desulfosediminicola flagellatus]|uniref:hypothetical protein n=1 Tax=Desulfosediminicola flagellatus TaxID=2569541 RepID=UPI0010AC0887|nr:hypothetical protein [Desulfosediminicola flagellatus]